MAYFILAAAVVVILVSFGVLSKKGYPWWLNVLNLLALLPVAAAPFVFFGSVFIFDHPSNVLLASLLFFGINSYSLVLLGSAWLSFCCYGKRETVKAVLLPSFFIVLVYSLVILFFIHR